MAAEAAAMAAEAAAMAATAMNVEATAAMEAATVEEVPGAIEAAEATPGMVKKGGVAAMAPTMDTVAAAITTTSRHTVFKARWLSIF
jgi:hypothetical protein